MCHSSEKSESTTHFVERLCKGRHLVSQDYDLVLSRVDQGDTVIVLSVVQNLLEGSGTSKVDLVIKLARRLLLFSSSATTSAAIAPQCSSQESGAVTRAAVQQSVGADSTTSVLVMGPWTGPYTKAGWQAAAAELDSALQEHIGGESNRIQYLPLIWKPKGGKVSKKDRAMQSKDDRLHPTKSGYNRILTTIQRPDNVFYKMVRGRIQ